jgi:hypothetical protein
VNERIISIQIYKNSSAKALNPLSHYSIRLGIRELMVASLLIMAMLFLNWPSKLNANPSIDFYSLNSPPPGIKSLEPLIEKWWNWWVAHPQNIANNWPQCLKTDSSIGNNKLVFTANPANAIPSNTNAREQKCEISASQLLYLTVYPGECSTGSKPGGGEMPDTKNPADLLACAQDSNKVIRLMKVIVDGQDVSSHIIRQSTSSPFKFVIPPSNVADYKAPIIGNNTSMAENYYLFFKPMPVGDHKIELEVIRQPLQANQPVEHDVAKWDIKVKP